MCLLFVVSFVQIFIQLRNALGAIVIALSNSCVGIYVITHSKRLMSSFIVNRDKWHYNNKCKYFWHVRVWNCMHLQFICVAKWKRWHLIVHIQWLLNEPPPSQESWLLMMIAVISIMLFLSLFTFSKSEMWKVMKSNEGDKKNGIWCQTKVILNYKSCLIWHGMCRWQKYAGKFISISESCMHTELLFDYCEHTSLMEVVFPKRRTLSTLLPNRRFDKSICHRIQWTETNNNRRRRHS